MNQQMILPRVSRDETTFAVVEFCGIDRRLLQKAVQRAVTAWVEQTETGRQVLKDNNGDFNVGDLANALSDQELQAALRKNGVSHLAIDVYCDDQPGHWDFDDRLVFDE